MPINVGEALCPDTAVRVSVERQTGGTRVNGRFVPTPPQIIKMLASPQQPTGSQLKFLEGAEKKMEVRFFICNKPVRTVNDRLGIAADIIIFKGLRFKVIDSKDWDIFGHSSVIGALIP